MVVTFVCFIVIGGNPVRYMGNLQNTSDNCINISTVNLDGKGQTQFKIKRDFGLSTFH